MSVDERLIWQWPDSPDWFRRARFSKSVSPLLWTELHGAALSGVTHGTTRQYDHGVPLFVQYGSPRAPVERYNVPCSLKNLTPPPPQTRVVSLLNALRYAVAYSNSIFCTLGLTLLCRLYHVPSSGCKRSGCGFLLQYQILGSSQFSYQLRQ